MGTSREARLSEKKFNQIWDAMRHLNNCVWANLFEDTKEYVELIKEYLDDMIKLMEQENV